MEITAVLNMGRHEIAQSFPGQFLVFTLPDRLYEETAESSGSIGYSAPLPDGFEADIERTFGSQVRLHEAVYGNDFIKKTRLLVPVILRARLRELLSRYFTQEIGEEILGDHCYSGEPTHIILRRDVAEEDWKVHVKPRAKNNGRKVLVTGIYPKTEIPIAAPEWHPGPEDAHTPVYETGVAGLEVATFNQKAGQDAHKHLVSTEIYTVLDGEVTIKVDDRELALAEGDELIVLPGTVHEVLESDKDFLVRVHAVNCYGDMDKYVQRDGAWCQVLTLKQQEKDREGNAR